MKEALFADYTPTHRNLTCIYCGSSGFCVETFGKEKNDTVFYSVQAVLAGAGGIFFMTVLLGMIPKVKRVLPTPVERK